MFKRIFFLLVLLMVLSQGMDFAEENKVLVLYDAHNYYGDERDAVLSISNLLKHFDMEMTFVQMDDYRGQLDQYNYVMLLCFRDRAIEPSLLHQLKDYGRPIMWVGKCLNQFVAQSHHGLYRYGDVNNLTRVVYKDRFYDIGIKRYFEQVAVTENSQVFSYLYDGAKKYPFIVKEDNLYYVSRMDLNEPLFYIFADVLYDFFDRAIEYGPRVFIKITDVNPYTDSEQLQEKVVFLLERGIPFAVSFSPQYREKGSRYVTVLSERSELVKVLKFIQENNQALIVQGGTQYYEAGSIEGESYFEWAGALDGEVLTADKSVETWIQALMNEALNECGYNGLFPIGFEGTHYMLNRMAYQHIGKVFDLYVGTLQTNDWQQTVIVYPWAIQNVNGLHHYLPDNLGFFSGQGTSELQRLKTNLDKMDIVGDFVGGISIAPSLDVQELEKLILFLENRNIRFYDLRRLSLEVRGEKVQVTSNIDQLVGESSVEDTQTPFSSVMDVIFIIVLMGLIYVFFSFYRMYKASKAKTDDSLF